MAKIKDCVVIERQLLDEIVIQLGLTRNTELSNKLLFNHRKLKPIIVDTWNEIDTTLHDYLNEKEI